MWQAISGESLVARVWTGVHVRKGTVGAFYVSNNGKTSMEVTACIRSTGHCIYEAFSGAHLHINLLKKASKLARHVQILKRRNWVMAMMKLDWKERTEITFNTTGYNDAHLGLVLSVSTRMLSKESLQWINIDAANKSEQMSRSASWRNVMTYMSIMIEDISILLNCYPACV